VLLRGAELHCQQHPTPGLFKGFVAMVWHGMSLRGGCAALSSLQVTTVLPGVALLYLTYNMAKPWAIR
jgi:hypothetical protein